ncbi:cytochrome P450 [Streptomyces sp. WI04-05B]|nr:MULTISPECIES: cytochrome P450 [Streptomyces]AAW49308.1 cytochrome P450 [Streptomyces turgidiscabies Car8]MDX2548209.1 cytochrome P450 [Streptomyces sp. WI04-05B]MDX2590246.1 cytochrome P450 [Streptomyces sp. WI04-05A]MDX3499998.1 cytochrome P450 [Streptomyces turgidiscabies]GAQ77383.1 cytochrome P450 FAS1 [Streptomyces turgidiscabies]
MAEAPELSLEMRRDGLDPIAQLARVRDTDGVVRVETLFGAPAYLVCRYEDVREVLADPVRFSNARSPLFGIDSGGDVTEEELTLMRAGNLLGFDPPEHTRLRRLLTPEFTVHRLRRLQPRIIEIVEAGLDDLAAAGRPADLMTHFALPVPSLVLCELLGVPYSDRTDFQDRSARLLDLTLPMAQREATRREDREYMAELVARAQADPQDDLLGSLVRQHGDVLTTDELIGIASLSVIAGHETTSNMIGLSTLALLRHPEQLALVRDDPALAEAAVEELLRWLSIAHSLLPRRTTTEVEIAGRTIPAGSFLILSIPAANRDSALVESPDALDIARGAAGHLAFGHGVHFCIGHALARMKMRIALPALLRRFPGLALADPTAEIEFRGSSLVFGLDKLRVTW